MSSPESKNSKLAEAQALVEQRLVKDVSKTAGYMLLEMMIRNDHAVLSFAKMAQDGVTIITKQDIDHVKKSAAVYKKELAIHEDENGMSLGFGLSKINQRSEKLSAKQRRFLDRAEKEDKKRELELHLGYQVSQIYPLSQYSIPRKLLDADVIELPSSRESV